MTPPQFYDTDYSNILADMVERYGLLTGRTLLPAQPEFLVLQAAAYTVKRIAEQNQAAATQMLLPFSNAPMLDYLAELQGVTRLPEANATVNLEFTLAVGHGGFTLPAGTRVAAISGQASFTTDNDVIALPGDLTLSVSATADTAGSQNNGFAIGQIARLVDRRLELAAVTNTSVSGGGADVETDAELRERIRLASGSFSVAGPANAYAFHARQASPAIIDVSVTTPEPGVVNVYPLVQGGVDTPDTILQLVRAQLDPETVVPLTDTVNVIAPTRRNLGVRISLVLYTDADPDGAVRRATTRIAEYLIKREQQLGLDINISQLTAAAIGDPNDFEVEDAIVEAPTADFVVNKTEFIKVGALTLTVIGTSDG
jgi:phage-related baseplate assembly protein